MKKRPMVVLNRILKTVKVITGFQSQNFADIAVLPEESPRAGARTGLFPRHQVAHFAAVE